MASDQSQPVWRDMTPADHAAVERIGLRVHPDHPEAPAVFAERLRLFPSGCLVLTGPSGVLGYVVAHPWRFGQPPSLDTLLGALPDASDTFYIHDIALLPETRGGGAGAAAVRLLAGQAASQGLPTMSLVAIGGSHGFWHRQGFIAHDHPDLRATLATYGTATRFMARTLI